MKIGILTFLAGLLGFLVTLFLIFMGMMDVPLGFLLGGVVVGGLNLLTALADKKDSKKDVALFTIVSITARLMVIVAVMVVIAFMYYRWQLRYFNLFSFVGIYTLSIIITAIVFIKERR